MDGKRSLPQVPDSVAQSPVFHRPQASESPYYSPMKSPMSSQMSSQMSASPTRSPTRSPNRSPTRSPVRSPVRSPYKQTLPYESVNSNVGQRLFDESSGSPVRKLQFAPNPADAEVVRMDSTISKSNSYHRDQAQRPLPKPMIEISDGTSPFDDSPSVQAFFGGSKTTPRRLSNASHDSRSTAATLIKDMASTSSRSSFEKGTESRSTSSGSSDNDNVSCDYDGRSLASFDTLAGEEDEDLPKGFQPRRNKSMSRKQVKLVRGNLVLDCPVPTKLYSFLPRKDSDEYVYMRYSACTADPDDFANAGFTIRPAIYERETEICVCVTMYNEDEILFTRTLHAVFKNIAYLCQRSKSKVWGPNGWKKVVVSIVSDGRGKINPRVLDCLAAMGVYQDGVAKNYVNGEEVQAHIFEYTAQVSLTPDLKFQGAEKDIVPVQMIFCLKERNAKKINSHRWLLNALCPQMNPNVVMLLDVGTRPAQKTLYHLWKAFDEDSNVAGACGEIKAMTGPFGKELLNPLVAAQNFEYKMSNILDKPFESVFGYISVLPGALSAYRYRALQNHEDGTGPLASYFKGERLDMNNAGIFEKNMYLAEDRILCWELVAKRGDKWVLKYVKAAKGETDVPNTLPEFISQRRRWLNGALFAALYSQTHFRQIWATDHSYVRKFFLHVEFLYQFMNLLFTFFSISNFYLAFYYVAGSIAGANDATVGKGVGLALFVLFRYLCVIAICAQFVLSLGNRPQGAKFLFGLTIVLLSLVTAYTMCIGLYFVVKTANSGSDASFMTMLTLVVSLLSTYGLYTIMSVLYCDPWHMLTSAIQYFLLLPGYVCTLQIYAFCNTHDITWGTKGDNEQKMDLGAAIVKKNIGTDVVEIEIPSEQVDIDTGYENALHCLREQAPVVETPVSPATKEYDYYREVRSRVVLVWMVCNLLLVMLVTQFISIDEPGKNVYLQVILWSMAVFAAIRALGSTVFLLQNVARSVHKFNYHTVSKWRRHFQKDLD